ncbi:MAG: hypothetical protein ACXVZH_14240 [Terriglobales bacterium]
MEQAFKALEDLLYGKMESSALAPPIKKGPCTKPCTLSLYPPRELPELRKIIDQQMNAA